MLKMNKKGETGEGAYAVTHKSVYWMVAGAMLIVAVFVYVYFLSGMNARLVYVPEKMRAEAISLRFANIPECFAYQDLETGRVYPGVIDLAKFNQQTMDDCYKTEEEKGYEEYNFRLLLKNKGAEVSTNNYFHGDEFTLNRKVLIKEGEQIMADEMIIYVQAQLFSHQIIKKVN